MFDVPPPMWFACACVCAHRPWMLAIMFETHATHSMETVALDIMHSNYYRRIIYSIKIGRADEHIYACGDNYGEHKRQPVRVP